MRAGAGLIWIIMSLISLHCSVGSGPNTFQLHILDEYGVAIPCRVLIRPVDGDCLAPADATE